jgi:hypothetical protein
MRCGAVSDAVSLSQCGMWVSEVPTAVFLWRR